MATTISPLDAQRQIAHRHGQRRSRRRPFGALVAVVAIGLGLALAAVSPAQADEGTGTITGRVVDSSGDPVPGITIEARHMVSAFDEGSIVDWSGTNGTFAIDVPPDTWRGYWLTFRDESSTKTYASHAIGDKDTGHVLVAGGVWAVGDITLTRLASISGKVTRPDGAPAASVWVTAGVDGEPATETWIRTAADGRYTLRVAPGATYTLRAYLSGVWQSATTTALPEQEDQALTGIDIVVTSVSCPQLVTNLAAAKQAHTRAQAARSAADKAAKAAKQQAATAKTKLAKATTKLKKAKKAKKATATIAKLKAKAKTAKSKAKTAQAQAGSSASAASKAAAALGQAASTLARAQADVGARCLP